MRKGRFLFALLLCSSTFLNAFNVSSANPSTSWYSRIWQSEDGLPSANVTGLAQTRDGFLWMATQSGLARFDGFKISAVSIPIARTLFIRTMLCDSSERFWLGQDNGVVILLSGTNQLMFSPTNGLPDSTPLQIVETANHNIWIAYADASVYRISSKNEAVRFGETANLPPAGAASLGVDSQGILWFAKDGWVGVFNGESFERLFSVERGAQILPAHNGGVWVATNTKIVKYRRDGRSTVLANSNGPVGHAKVTVLFEDSADRLWVGRAAEGLWLLDGEELRKVSTSQNNIRTVMEDREGNIWVGTDGGGLDRLRQRVVDLFGRQEGLPFETVRSISEDRAGDLWVVTQDGALTVLNGTSWSNVHSNLNWTGGLAHCTVADKNGDIWIGTYSHGLIHWSDGKFKRITAKDGLAGLSVRSLMLAHNGDLWVGLEAGSVVQHGRGGVFESFALPEGSRAVRAMVEDTAGRVWMGTLGGRLLRWADGKVADVTTETARPYHPIRCLQATPDGCIWIGYAAGGVGRIKNGRFSKVTEEQGLYDNNICAFVPDDHGKIWMAADRGLFWIDAMELNAAADSPTNHCLSVVYGRDEGLPGLQAYYGYSPGPLKTKQGEILFPTHSGIAIVRTDRVQANLVPPKVLIEQITTADQKIDFPGVGQTIHFSPGLRNLEIAFTAPSFIAPEQMQFQYRLEGWNDSWVESSRERKASFPRLPPGNYVFRVRARNNSGIWSENNALIPFLLEPYFWQKTSFIVVISLAFIVGLILLVRHLSLRRAALMLKRAEQVSALQNERARIAQDMHDDLGAQFTQISLLGELARSALPQPEKSSDFLDKISAVARSGVKSLDEIVWAVNPRNDMLPDLLDYAGQYALNFLSNAGINCRLDFPENPPNREMSGELRHAIFLIIKEALNNVVRHAQATHVRIVFDFDETEMRWAVEDNGLGFSKTPDDALADGLRNMRQRAEALGGGLAIKSASGSGTKLRLTIPWHN